MTPKSLFSIVKKLVVHLSNLDADSMFDLEYRNLVGNTILDCCCKNVYENIEDFEWFVQILIDLCNITLCDISEKIKLILIDLCIRIPDIRPYTIDKVVLIF